MSWPSQPSPSPDRQLVRDNAQRVSRFTAPGAFCGTGIALIGARDLGHMLKLERTDAMDGAVTLYLHGRVGGEWVTELEHACAGAIDAGARPLRLDLSDVTYIDQAGLALSRRLWPHVTILHSSLFAAELLKPLADCPADGAANR